MIGLYNYWMVIILMMLGLYGVLVKRNLFAKIIFLSIFQTSCLIFYISLGKVSGGAIPIIKDEIDVYTSPLPHVLMLTAIVVGVATLAVGLALIIRIRQSYKTIDEDEITKLELED